MCRTVPAAQRGNCAKNVNLSHQFKGILITWTQSGNDEWTNQQRRTRFAEDGGSCALRFERRRLLTGLEAALDAAG